MLVCNKISRELQDCRVIHEVSAEFLEIFNCLGALELDDEGEMGADVEGLGVQADEQAV